VCLFCDFSNSTFQGANNGGVFLKKSFTKTTWMQNTSSVFFFFCVIHFFVNSGAHHLNEKLEATIEPGSAPCLASAPNLAIENVVERGLKK